MRRRNAARRGAAALLVVLAGGLLVGCTSTAAGGDSAGSSAGGTSTAAGTATGTAGKASSVTAQQVVTTGDLDLVARHPLQAAARVSAIVIGAGGRIDAEDEQPSGGGAASLTARIPAAALPAARQRITHEGTVRGLDLHSTDVTGRVTDTAIRIAGLRASIARLQTLLGRASTTTDLVDLETSLTTRQTDLEQLEAQQRTLADQVRYATLAITIEAPAAVKRAAPGTFVSGFAAGLSGLLATGAALLVGLGVALPWLVVLGLLAGVSVLVARRIRARRRPAPAA